MLVNSTQRIRRDAELRQDEGRLVFQDDHPLKRINDIVGRQGVAAMEFYVLAQMKGPGLAVRRNLIGLCQRKLGFVKPPSRKIEQAVVNLGIDAHT